MKNTVFILILATLSITSCGKKNKISTNPINGQIDNPYTRNTDTFITQVLAVNGMPKSKDNVRYTQKLQSRSNRGSGVCSFIANTSVLVLSSSQNNIRLSVRKSIEGNNFNCSIPSNRNSTQNQNLTTSQFLAEVKTKVNRILNPNIFCQDNKEWCERATLVAIKDVNHQNKLSVYVEADFFSKTGRSYKSKSYISKTSLLLNVYQTEMRDIRTGEVMTYKKLVTSNRAPRRPNR